MRYIIDGETFTNAADAATYITENMDETYYEDMLNEVYGEINVCGYFYDAADALYKLDPVAYQCGMNDYYDSLWSDIKYDINRMDEGDEEEFYGLKVEIPFEEEEEEEEEEE